MDREALSLRNMQTQLPPLYDFANTGNIIAATEPRLQLCTIAQRTTQARTLTGAQGLQCSERIARYGLDSLAASLVELRELRDRRRQRVEVLAAAEVQRLRAHPDPICEPILAAGQLLLVSTF